MAQPHILFMRFIGQADGLIGDMQLGNAEDRSKLLYPFPVMIFR